MKIANSYTSYKELVEQLNYDGRVNELERCVILYQMGTFVGNDIFNKLGNIQILTVIKKMQEIFWKLMQAL